MDVQWPQWTAELTEDYVKGEDQLGIQGAAQSFQQYLVPGVITTTDRARYYSFYAWVLYRFIHLTGSTRLLSDFRGSFFRRHEIALILSSYCHHKDKGVIGGLVGSGTNNSKARSYWESGDPISLDMDYFQNKLGGFGQYYRTAMQVMGIIAESEHPKWVYRLTHRGEELAQSFEESIAQTKYFQELTETNELEFISQIDALEFGRVGCICHDALRQGNDFERLRDAFFRFDQKEPGNPHERRRLTLGVTLDMVYSGQGNVNQGDLRPGLYLGEFSPGLYYKPADELKDWASRWQMVQIRQLYTFGLECLWAAFLRHIGSLPRDITFEEYLEWLRRQLPAGTSEMSVSDYLDDLCFTIGLAGSWRDVHSYYDDACRMDTESNEYSLYLDTIENRRDNQVLIRNGLQILTQLFLRFYERYVERDPTWMELGTRERLPLNSFYSQFEDHLSNKKCTVADLLAWLYREFILGQHEFIALEKLRYQQYDTFKFYYRDGCFYWPFPAQDTYQEPIRLATIRLFNTTSILTDLGMIESDEEGRLRLTEDGKTYRQRVLEARHNDN